MRFEIFKFNSVTSTNEKAVNLVKDKKKECGCIYADTQTKGKGTHGKAWVSEIGNFYGSIFFPLEEKYPPFNEFSIINPVIVSKVINRFCNKKKISLKWPNDVFVNKKKICGILQEVITFNNKKFLVIGIGINLISNPKINVSYQATNIYIETKNEPTTKEIMNLLIHEYEDFFYNLNSYNFRDFKNKAESMVISN